MKAKIKRVVALSLSTIGLIAISVSIGIAEEYRTKYGSVLSAALGDSGRSYSSVNYDGVDNEYYKRKYDDNELLTKEQELSDKICEEGFVTLKNGNIPYKKSTKFSLFSESSVNLLYGGTGSGSASSSLTLKDAFEDEDFSINSSLWNFYSSGKGKNYRRGIGAINYGDSDDYSINECPLSLIKEDSNLVKSFDEYNTGIFVLSRTGGEGNDLARGMSDYVDTVKDTSSGYHKDSNEDKRKSYLEPDSIEFEIMDYINSNFKDFILIINSNNPLELGWTSKYSNLKTIIQLPGTGNNGLKALPRILDGSVSSSGKLTDTFSYNAFSAPAMQNMGDFEYLVDGKKMANIKGYDNFAGTYYTNYQEGIYVGYRYYETRYEDAILNAGNAKNFSNNEISNSKELGYTNWDYSKEVKYPFGYGDSLAKFQWSDFSVINVDESNFEASITVKNTSNVKGKDVVELYAQTPYGDYEKANNIEKSSVDLIGFQKTKELAPDEEETIKIDFSLEDLKVYDAYNQQGYILSEGDYYFTAGFDAHAAINNILKAKGYGPTLTTSPSEDEAGNSDLVVKTTKTFDNTTFTNDTTTNTKITNQFDFVDKKQSDSSYKYLSRKDYVNTFPKIDGEVSNILSIHSERVNGVDSSNNPVGYEYVSNLDKNSDTYKQIVNYETLNDKTDKKEVKWNQESNLDLVDLRGLDKDDPRYDELVSKMSFDEATNLISKGGYETISIKTINKPRTKDYDGPAGFNTVSGHFSLGYTFPCALTIAQTYNPDLALELGKLIGEEGLKLGISGWYGPATNIHRTPFGGRNFEYFSEDPYISGIFSKSEVNGAAQKGVYAYLKHFALNDQENHREKENGICTFANEQSIRQIYLKPFEMAIKDNEVDVTYYELQRNSDKEIILNANDEPTFVKKNKKVAATNAIMTSFNRFNGVWAGGCYPLLNNVLKEEWGFHGLICTDYYHFWFMDKNQSVVGGGNLVLDPENNVYNKNIDDEYYVQKACKELLYTIANSNAVNGYIHGTVEYAAFPKYMIYVIIIYCFLALLMAALVFVIVFNTLKMIKENKNEKKIS